MPDDLSEFSLALEAAPTWWALERRQWSPPATKFCELCKTEGSWVLSDPRCEVSEPIFIPVRTPPLPPPDPSMIEEFRK